MTYPRIHAPGRKGAALCRHIPHPVLAAYRGEVTCQQCLAKMEKVEPEWAHDPRWLFVILLVALTVILAVAAAWANIRYDPTITQVDTMDTTSTSTSTTVAPVSIDDRGWPATWPTRHQIGLMALGVHLDHAESSMAVEQSPDGEIVIVNPPEAPTAFEPADGWTVWDHLAACESGDKHVVGSANWHINTGNGYSGGLQWHPDTWRRAGGHQYAPHAWQATREQQIAVAEAWLARTSWGQWPGCARWLGLR